MWRHFSAAFLLLAAVSPARAECPVAALQQAAGARNLAAAVQAREAIDAAGALCSAGQRSWAGNLTAMLYGAEAQRLLATGATAHEALAMVDRGLHAGQPWRLLRLRGQLITQVRDTQGRADWIAASLAFQAALNDIADRRDGPEPTRDDIEDMLLKAEETRMLAAGIVRSPVTRSGGPGGLDLPAIRGVTVSQAAQPIHFVWNTPDFTDQGREAADLLAEMLHREGDPQIQLIGHCDESGPDEFNMWLSRQRAASVRDYLERNGYPHGRIDIEGRGWHDKLPRALDGISDDEYNKILRRVDLVRR